MNKNSRRSFSNSASLSTNDQAVLFEKAKESLAKAKELNEQTELAKEEVFDNEQVSTPGGSHDPQESTELVNELRKTEATKEEQINSITEAKIGLSEDGREYNRLLLEEAQVYTTFNKIALTKMKENGYTPECVDAEELKESLDTKYRSNIALIEEFHVNDLPALPTDSPSPTPSISSGYGSSVLDDFADVSTQPGDFMGGDD